MHDMWQMLRSHHLGHIKQTGKNLHVGGYRKYWSHLSRCGGGRVCAWLVWSIAGRVITFGLCWPAVVGVGGSQVVINWCTWPAG